MASVTNDLSYKSIIWSFFVNDKLIAQRNERINTGLQYVVDNVPVRNLSQKLQDVVRNKVSNVEMIFMRKWRESKAKSKEEFETHYEKWIHTHLTLPKSILSENSLQRGSTQTKKQFDELSARQKNRRVEDLKSIEVGELLLAAANSAKLTSQMDLYYVLKLLHDDREKASEIRSLIKAEKSRTKLNDK